MERFDMIFSQKIEISVIVPIYNAEKFLFQCLQSIYEQSLTSIEVICVDDGSVDSSGLIIDKFIAKDGRFKKMTSNRIGAGGARNLGLKAARGKYIVFLDADDWFEPQMLERAFRRSEQDSLDICLWGVTEYDSVTEQYNADNPHFREELLPKADVFNKRDCKFLFNMTSGAPWNKMYLMSFLKRNDLQFMEIEVCNDLFMTYSALLSAGRIAAIRERFTFYRIHNKNSLQDRKGG